MLPWMLRSRRPHCVSSTARAPLFLKPMWQAIPMRLRIVLHLITASCDDTNVDHDRSMHLHELSKKPLTSTPMKASSLVMHGRFSRKERRKSLLFGAIYFY